MNPFTYRPMQPRTDDETDWEDTAGSNAMAWFSEKVLPNWCQTENHWTSKVSNYFWTDCPCCLFWRGATIGAAFMLLINAIF